MDDTKACHSGVEEVHFYSDGAASQFKQKYLFDNLTFFEGCTCTSEVHLEFFCNKPCKKILLMEWMGQLKD